jgi:hypothetical protein
MTAIQTKPYSKGIQPDSEESVKQYIDDELRKIRESIALLVEAMKQLQAYIGSPPL